MFFENIKSNKSNHKILIQDVNKQNIPHAQLFYGNGKSGTLATALAYAKYIFCANKKNDSACSVCANCNKMNLLINRILVICTIKIIRCDILRHNILI